MNKPLGLSPPDIEFKRTHLYDINPVGVGSMLAAFLFSMAAYMGAFGELARAFSPFIALATAFPLAPLIAWLTGGRYYLARRQDGDLAGGGCSACCICGNEFDREDQAYCPAYAGTICSLCCALDARCGDACKPGVRMADQVAVFTRWWLPNSLSNAVRTRIGNYLLVFTMLAMLTGALQGMIYYQEFISSPRLFADAGSLLYTAFLKAFVALLVFLGIGAWWLVLASESRQAAQDESNKQTSLLLQEIE